MEWLNQFADILRDNWAKVLLIFSTPVVSGLTIWQICNLIIAAYKRKTAKKVLDKITEVEQRVDSKIAELKDFVVEKFKEQGQNTTQTIANTFNELQLKTQETKQAIYEKIFDTKMEVKEITQEVKTEIDNEIAEIKKEAETEDDRPVEEIIKDDSTEIEEETKVDDSEETPKVDLL